MLKQPLPLHNILTYLKQIYNYVDSNDIWWLKDFNMHKMLSLSVEKLIQKPHGKSSLLSEIVCTRENMYLLNNVKIA